MREGDIARHRNIRELRARLRRSRERSGHNHLDPDQCLSREGRTFPAHSKLWPQPSRKFLAANYQRDGMSPSARRPRHQNAADIRARASHDAGWKSALRRHRSSSEASSSLSYRFAEIFKVCVEATIAQSQRNIVVLFPDLRDLLVLQHPQRPDDAPTGGVRADDVVDVAAAGGDERI